MLFLHPTTGDIITLMVTMTRRVLKWCTFFFAKVVMFWFYCERSKRFFFVILLPSWDICGSQLSDGNECVSRDSSEYRESGLWRSSRRLSQASKVHSGRRKWRRNRAMCVQTDHQVPLTWVSCCWSLALTVTTVMILHPLQSNPGTFEGISLHHTCTFVCTCRFSILTDVIIHFSSTFYSRLKIFPQIITALTSSCFSF